MNTQDVMRQAVEKLVEAGVISSTEVETLTYEKACYMVVGYAIGKGIPTTDPKTMAHGVINILGGKVVEKPAEKVVSKPIEKPAEKVVETPVSTTDEDFDDLDNDEKDEDED